MSESKRKITAIFIIVFVINTMIGAEEGDSLSWRGPGHNGIYEIENWTPAALDKELPILWQAEIGAGYAGVGVAGNKLYTLGNAGNQDTVWCLEVDTGKTVWKYSYAAKAGEYKGPYATPVIDNGLVYSFDKSGVLNCLNAATGKVVWQKSIDKNYGNKAPQWGIAGSPLIAGNMIILNALQWGIALDKTSGAEIWKSSGGTSGYATPVQYTCDNKQCLAIFGSIALYGVELETGKKLWEYPWSNSSKVNAADPLVVGNRFFISTDYGKGCALLEVNNNKPELVWKNSLFNSYFSSFVYKEGYIYGNDGDAKSGRGYFRCVEMSTGKELWNAKLGLGSLVMVNNHLILLTAKGSLHVVQAIPKLYSEVSTGQLPAGNYWTAPVIAKGKLFCRSTKGTLVCVAISGKP